MQGTGARTIDINVAIGDSVVATRQLSSPRGGAISGGTKALVASAAVALACALGAFGHGVHVASQNERSLKRWVEVEKLPALEFRARRLSPLYDVLAIGGLVSGLGMLGWALARAHAERRSPYFRIGRTADAELASDDVPAGVAAFPLVAPQGDRFVFSWAPGMKGEMFTGGRLIPLSDVPQGATIPDDARIRVENGTTTFRIVAGTDARPAIGAGPLDGRLAGFAGISAVAHGVLLILLFMIPDRVKGLSDDPMDEAVRQTRIRMPAMEPPKPVETMKPDDKGAEQALSGDAGKKLTGASGTMGKPDVDKDKTGGYRMKQNGDPTLARAEARERATHSGVLGAIRKAGAFSHVTGQADFSSGLDKEDIYGGLIDPEAGVAWGNNAYGTGGLGPGGGGDGLNTIGTGSWGTIGRCTAAKCGKGPGWGTRPGGAMVASDRQPRAPKPEIGRAVLAGDTDASMIRQKIRQRLDRIQYCYERALVGDPTLRGTVNTQFTIDGTGKVIAIVASGVSDEVSSCVADVIRGIQFPTGGQMVQVTSYPFRFNSPSIHAAR